MSNHVPIELVVAAVWPMNAIVIAAAYWWIDSKIEKQRKDKDR